VPRRAVSHPCLVPGCARTGHNQLGIRCRVAHAGQSPFPQKRRTDAIYSLETAAYLCDFHALAGGQIELRYTPSRSGAVSAVAMCGPNMVEERTKEIQQPYSSAA
jgi:hypothetical protein